MVGFHGYKIYYILYVCDVCTVIYEKGNRVNNVTIPVNDNKTAKKLFYKFDF